MMNDFEDKVQRPTSFSTKAGVAVLLTLQLASCGVALKGIGGWAISLM